MLRFVLDLGGVTAGAGAGAGEVVASGGSALGSMLPLIAMVGIFYLLLLRPQRKRDKQAQQMRSQLEVGDEVITGGGIVGRIVTINEDTLLIETGSNNTKLRIAKWAIQANNTAKERSAPAEKPAELTEGEGKKGKKKKDKGGEEE